VFAASIHFVNETHAIKPHGVESGCVVSMNLLLNISYLASLRGALTP